MSRLLPERLLDLPLARFPSLWQNVLDSDLFPVSDLSENGMRVYEQDKQLFVEVPLPGLDIKDIEVTINKGVLHIKGESKEEEKDKKKKFYRTSSRNYSYSLVLPTLTDEKQEPQAVYTDGILKLSMQIANSEETKKISVKPGNQKK